ncbi:flavin reductase family protein [Streptomyces sp. MS06]|uniref:flavin reductase family protein n=1 Tax=Streptomyces sp. MS06 TaxID=3385974 RepID=UPI00399FA925
MTASDVVRRVPAPAAHGDRPGPDELRKIFGRFATGITVLTAGREDPRGMTANSFTSVSLSPPLILVCVMRSASMHRVIEEHGAFAVSVLSADQEAVARHFADRTRPRGEKEFAAVDAVAGPNTGAPVIRGALAWFECSLAAVHDGGDHSIFVGEVRDLGCGGDDDALLYYAGAYRLLHRDPARPAR